MQKTVIIVLFLVFLAGGIHLYRKFRKTIRLFSKAAFGTDSLIEGVKSQDSRLATTPKSVAAMTSLFLPQIQRDFPEFSLAEFVQKSENQLRAGLAAVECQDLEGLQEVSDDLKYQLKLWIEDDRKRGLREHFQKIRIHRTEISRYQKHEGCCVITLQSALEYEYWKEKLDGTGTEEKRRIQTRYDMELMYVQDVEKLPSGASARVVVCPQCGAPVARLGSKFCEYCGSGIEPLNIRVWSLNRIREC